MKTATLALLGLAGAAWYLYTQRAQSDAALAPFVDAGWNYPAIYPNVTGSPAVDPIGMWPGWLGTPPYNAGWPGMPPEAPPPGYVGPIF
jgi:hypothetical protein